MQRIRRTKLVNSVLQVFEQTDEAISAVELVERLHREMNRTTVYRILGRLEKEGTLRSFIGKGRRTWYEKSDSCSSLNLKKHPHFQCRDCGRIECLYIDVPIPAVPNYKIETAELILIGQCEACRS